MITLSHVSHLNRPQAEDPIVVLGDVSVLFRAGERVGILAAPGSGKSTLARLFSGIEQPDEGLIERQGRVSWPLGFAAALHPELSGAENIGLIGAILGQDPDEMIAFCDAFSGLGARMQRPLKYASPGDRALLAFSCSLAVPYATYIADEVLGVGSDQMRARCQAMLDRRLTHAGLIFLSRNPAQIKKTCTTFYVLVSGKLIACSDPAIGAEVLKLSRVPGADLGADDMAEMADL